MDCQNFSSFIYFRHHRFNCNRRCGPGMAIQIQQNDQEERRPRSFGSFLFGIVIGNIHQIFCMFESIFHSVAFEFSNSVGAQPKLCYRYIWIIQLNIINQNEWTKIIQFLSACSSHNPFNCFLFCSSSFFSFSLAIETIYWDEPRQIRLLKTLPRHPLLRHKITMNYDWMWTIGFRSDTSLLTGMSFIGTILHL